MDINKFNKLICKYERIHKQNSEYKNIIVRQKKEINEIKEKNQKLNLKLSKINSFTNKKSYIIAKNFFKSLPDFWWVPDEVQFDIYLKNVKLIQNLIEKYLKI